VEYRFPDLRRGLPDGSFDNIIWDAAVAYFTEAEIASILQAISRRLGADGILCGFTLASDLADGDKYVEAHEREFRDADDIRGFFAPYFANIFVWETTHPDRRNLYFACSQRPINVFGQP
jgi:SAM-dependent methyltransferase